MLPSLLPADCYFYAGDSSKRDKRLYDINSVVIICPADYFDKNGHIYDGHLSRRLKPHKPDGLGEEQEGQFSTSDDVPTITAKLLELGYRQTPRFSGFCQSHDPFVNLDVYDHDEDEE